MMAARPERLLAAPPSAALMSAAPEVQLVACQHRDRVALWYMQVRTSKRPSVPQPGKG